jgi:phosphopantothenoylcysteine decarboxylase/phosphopantothenate--cysteine ligase
MANLQGKKIVLGVTGSIAAYKSALIIRELTKAGADVFVIMTESAAKFITPLSLANLSRNPVSGDMFDMQSQQGGAWHIHRAHECDLMIIAPCSATTLGKLANGICDNSLIAVATALPKDIPLLIAPAMDSTMYESASTQRNLATLESDGAIIIPPDDGELSSGITGPGRLPEIDVIIEQIKTSLESKKKTEIDSVSKIALKGKKVLITAGPTREKIDDVRFISNYSSGKMGFALAEVAVKNGAEVTLISGPVNIGIPKNINYIAIESANEMYEAVLKQFDNCDICIMSAAVSDFAPLISHEGKIKKDKQEGQFSLELKLNTDILSKLGSIKENQILVGFALESSNEIANAKSKLRNKNCDLLVLNSANKPDSGFEGDRNTITILNKNDKIVPYPVMTKMKCATVIFEQIINYSKNS